MEADLLAKRAVWPEKVLSEDLCAVILPSNLIVAPPIGIGRMVVIRVRGNFLTAATQSVRPLVGRKFESVSGCSGSGVQVGTIGQQYL